MRRYQHGDTEGAARLVERLSPRIFQFFLMQVRERPWAEDLLQDFWLRIHHARHTFRSGEPLLPWAYAIARRVQVDGYRRKMRILTHEISNEELVRNTTAPIGAETRPKLVELLKTLPPAQREVLLLLKVGGLSLEEAARATGTTVGAVKQKAHRAYTALRKLAGGGR